MMEAWPILNQNPAVSSGGQGQKMLANCSQTYFFPNLNNLVMPYDSVSWSTGSHFFSKQSLEFILMSVVEQTQNTKSSESVPFL